MNGQRSPAAVREPAASPARWPRREAAVDADVARDLGRHFHYDLRRVRIHPDRADMLPPDTLAGTIGESIYFAPGAYQPASPGGRRVLAHELAHVIQQSRRGGPGASAPAAAERERDADRAAAAAASGRDATVDTAAPLGLQCFPIQRGSRTYEVGDVQLNAAAQVDVTRHGNLVVGPDQGHLIVHGGKLGYDVGYTTPEDPFRWRLLRRTVDSAHLDIRAVSEFDHFRVKEAIGAAAPTIVSRTLMELGAGGITLLTLGHARASDPGRRSYIASPDDARDQVIYATGRGGRGIIGTNSLAHELFGHFALGIAGAPSRHGAGPVPASAGVQDPFAQPFVGTVDEYISSFAGASTLAGPLESPTFNVGPAFVRSALADLRANGAAGLSGSRSTPWRATAAFERTWTLLSQNYRALRNARRPAAATPTGPAAAPRRTGPPSPAATPGRAAPPATAATTRPTPGTTTTTGRATAPATAAPLTAASLLTDVRAWATGLSADKRWVLSQFLDRYTRDIIATKPPELAGDVRSAVTTP